MTYKAVHKAFANLLKDAGVHRFSKGHQHPSLYSLRHTAAVHRVVCWYQQGEGLQLLLPALSTHLGHADLRSTQVYLSMMPELLQEAASRFHHYLEGVNHE